MITIKEVFDLVKDEVLEGSNSIEELAISYGLEDGYEAYFMILDPDSPNYDNYVSNLEMDFNMISAGYCDTKAGYIENDGEVGRIGFFQNHIDENRIREILKEVLFDIIKIN